MASKKVDLQSDVLMEKLNLRLADATYIAPVSKSYSNSNGLLTVDKSASALDDWAMILIGPISPAQSGLTDALGLTQRVYSPHVIKVLFDRDASDASHGTTTATRLAILGEVLRTGMDVELYEVDAAEKGGNKYLEVGDIAAGNLKGSFQNLEWSFQASV